MSVEQLVFYCFAAILLFSGLMVITVGNPVRAALFLILAFFTSAAIWLLLAAEFLALTLVLVYVGAVMVLFLFVVMMLDIDLVPLQQSFARYLPLAIVVAALITIEMITVLGSSQFGLELIPAPEPHPDGYSNTKAIGRVLYSVYLYPFEIAALILTVAIVAAIILTLREKSRKSQNVADQLKVRREDRVRIVKMEPVVKSEPNP